MSSGKVKKEVLPEKETHVSKESDFIDTLRSVMADAPPEYLEVLAPTIKELIGLVQIATLGNAKSVPEMLEKPGNFFGNLLTADKGILMGYFQARALHQVMTTESKKDPLDWAKLMIDVQKATNAKGNEDRGPASSGTKETEYQLIRELEQERKEVQKAKSRGNSS